MLILFIAILFIREFFWLLPQQFVVMPNIIRLSDIGILMIFGIVLFDLASNYAKNRFARSSFAWVILGFIFLSILNVSFSNIYYDQPITVGLRAIRSNLSYCVFFAVVSFLNDKEKILRFIRWLTLLCILLVAVTALQYAIPSIKIFHTDNIGIFQNRFGVARQINPGLDLLILVYFIVIARFIKSGFLCGLQCLVIGIVFSVSISLSQVRAYLLSIPISIIISLIVTRKYRWFIVTTWCFVVCVSVFQVAGTITQEKHENLITKLIESSISETIKKSGNVGIRIETAIVYWNYAMQHPVTGTGIISPVSDVAKKLNYPVLRTDLGYVIMFSQYGLLGIGWLIWLSSVYFKKVAYVYQRIVDDDLKTVVFGLMSHFIFMLISFITLPHFILATMIVTVAINMAILESIQRLVIDAALQEKQLHVLP